ncbi:hypothetical protein [Methanothermobacter sp. K4]|uniref:hypothetical protein n=1 Tax=Methanothermobacter sp. K4 TaxID=2913262 RepID=UPI001EDC5A48|nr:hypothetical protein [Methanothermobacter sp. K4]MCG2829194.1 hypothetical protein [Methanothermobacter sp. K4]
MDIARDRRSRNPVAQHHAEMVLSSSGTGIHKHPHLLFLGKWRSHKTFCFHSVRLSNFSKRLKFPK